MAIDASNKEIVGVYIGKKDQTSAQGLWDSLPPVYRQCAVSYTDFWSAYGTVFPQKRYKAVGKETGLTNYIERFNNTMRQRISKLVRKTLSFSKKSPIILGLFGILFMSITPVYLSIKTPDFPCYAGLPKILASCVSCNLGYVAIAIELIHTVTGLERESNHAIVFFFVAHTSKLDMATINKAHLLFEHGLLIKSIQAQQGTL